MFKRYQSDDYCHWKSYHIKGVVVIELFNYATKGANLVPTILLILILLYWILAMIGTLDLELFDLDLDMDAEVGEDFGLLSMIALFLNVGKVPSGLVVSILVLNFWVLSMLTYLLPWEFNGIAAWLMLIPSLIVGLYITKVELIPLRKLFKDINAQFTKENEVLIKDCELLCDVSGDRLGQAKVNRKGANIVVNVKAEFDNESFSKGEQALISRKSFEKNIYFIRKSKG